MNMVKENVHGSIALFCPRYCNINSKMEPSLISKLAFKAKDILDSEANVHLSLIQKKNESMKFGGRGQTPNPNFLVFILVILKKKIGGQSRAIDTYKKFGQNLYFTFFFG
jgi:hypothetical protein